MCSAEDGIILMKLKNTSDYKTMSLPETFTFLQTSAEGLSVDEADTRLKTEGYNEIHEVKENKIRKFLKRYWGPMPWLLELAIVLTVILSHFTESVIIFILLTANAVIGYLQSQNAQKAVKLLKKKLKVNAKVLRDGVWTAKEARDIVPGDIITVKLGDIVPADGMIVSGEISADESALTGESLPKSLHPSDIVYSSSIVKNGEAKCVATNTGVNTYFGTTVDLVKKARPKSKQEELMLNIVKYMLYVGIAASIVVTLYAVYLHKDFLFILSFIVIFLIGAIPVALPAVLTVVQAVGALELSKKGVLVTRLDSVEDAASIDIFCFDKTGTITQNKLTVVDSASFDREYDRSDVLKFAALASRAEGMDAIDIAILNCAKALPVSFDNWEKVSYTPFDPQSRRTEAVIKYGETRYRILKGAPRTLLELCRNTEESMTAVATKTIDDFSQRGYRTIAVAVSREDDPLKFIGLLAISDPPREDSEKMIAEIKNLGVRPIMLTGDNIAIAREISKKTGIGSRIRRVGELEGLSHQEQLNLIKNSDGFAEVYPEDKYTVVKLLQESGHMIGMTGDGVNDSPALKQAELGTAVSEATDVAKASASIVLTKPGLSEIIDALIISRKTYQRMLTWVINKIVKVIEVVVLFTVGFFWLHNIVISLLGMSLLVFANDFVTMSIAADNVESTPNPNRWNIRNITSASLFLGIFFAIEDLLMIFIGLNVFHLSFERIQTLVMLSLVFNTQFRILTVRERRHIWSSFPNRNMLMINIAAIILFVLLGIFGIVIPSLPIMQVLTILGIAVLFMLIIDLIKYYLFRYFNV